MDGAGRLARSVRSLGPRAELLKAAARGALILLQERLAPIAQRLAPLRAYVAAIKRARAERLTRREQNPHRLILKLEHYTPRRIGVIATLMILFGSAVLGIVKGGHGEEVTT